MRLIFFLLLSNFLNNSCLSQELKRGWDFGLSFDLSFGYKFKSNYVYDNNGSDIIRNINVFGRGGGVQFTSEYNKKWGILFRFGFIGFDWSNKKFNNKMNERLGDGYLTLTPFSINRKNHSSHGLNIIELSAKAQYVFFQENKFNYLIDAGVQFTSWRNPEYCYIYRTPSTNYYKIFEMTNTRSSLRPMLDFGFSLRKRVELESGGEIVGYGYFALRLGIVYGFKEDDEYTITSENQLGEITTSNILVPVNTCYLNLRLSMTIMK